MHSVLATNLYEIVDGFNIGVVIKAILKNISKSAVLLILYIYSKSLYYYLVRLGGI